MGDIMTDESVDIFDKLIDLPILRRFKGVYTKYKEGLLYLFFGGLTFFLAIIVFVIFSKGIGLNVLYSNIISWVSGVTISFFTTRKWVFKTRANGLTETFIQMTEFYLARVATLGLQELLLYVFVTKMEYNSIYVKIMTEVINIILNYLVSKFLIFRKR